MTYRRLDRISSGSLDESVDTSSYIHDYLRLAGVVDEYSERVPYSKSRLRSNAHQRRIYESDEMTEDIVERALRSERSRRRQYEDVILRDGLLPLVCELTDSTYHRSRSARMPIDHEFSFSRKTPRRSAAYQLRRGRSVSDVNCACKITMIYGEKSSSPSSNDEVIVMQDQNDDGQLVIVYKGFLQRGDKFSFKSQRLAHCPFKMTFYVNGHVEAHLSTCCEYKYREGDFRLGAQHGKLTIEHVGKSNPCHRCRRDQEKYHEKTVSRQSSVSSGTSSRPEDLKRENQISAETANKKRSHPPGKPPVEMMKDEMRPTSAVSRQKVSTEAKQTNGKESSDDEKDDTGSGTDALSPLQRMLAVSGGGASSAGGNLLQSLLAMLQNAVHRQKTREPIPDRHQGNVENVVVILLGVPDESDRLRSIVNFVKIFDDADECNGFLNPLQVEKILLIVTDDLIESINDPSRLHAIYLLSENVESANNDQPNVRGIFQRMDSICEQIEDEYSTNVFFSIKSISPQETSDNPLTYSQLLEEILLMKDNEADLKKDLLGFCRFHYADNDKELALIDEFERDFKDDKAIWWFTRGTFLRKVLERALRTQEVDLLYKMRFFFQPLNAQIKAQSLSSTVYRIHHMDHDQFEKIKEHTPGGLLTFGTFLGCTLTKPSSVETIDGMKSIVFSIKTTVGAEVNHLRHPESDIEVLLALDTVFRIESIEENSDDNQWWNINLTSIPQDDQQWIQLTKDLRDEIGAPIVLVQLTKLLLKVDKYTEADYLARLLFNDDSLKENVTLLASLASVHHLLGSADHQQGNHRAARLQFEQSLKIFLTFVPADNQILSATYNNIGSMFYQENEYDQAIVYHQKAIDCQLKSSSPDVEAIATYSSNIGAVCLELGKHNEALLHYQRALKILEQSTPDEGSKSIAMINDRIASVYWRMEKPADALPFYERALELELKYLPADDHKISVSYFNLSTAYARLDRLDDAIASATKSVEQLLKSVPPDHPEVKENMEQLEGLRRKKWLQQLYS